MEAEVAALSQLQLQLLALVSELRLLRERDRAAREELHASSQRWNEAEEEHRREARQLRAEVAAREGALRRLESRIKCLENENELLEKNEKDLKESMEGLLQSREAFIKHYEDSACSLQWNIQMKDKQIAVISEKLNSHLALFSSVGKEVAAVKQVLGDVECLVDEKKDVVSDLKGKVQRISVLEKDFVEKLSFLEGKISSYQLELRNRARIIYELKEHLEAEKLNNKFQPQLEELRKSLLVKDEIIERLTSEKQVILLQYRSFPIVSEIPKIQIDLICSFFKQAMLMELHNMEIALRQFQDIFGSIGHEGMKSSGSQDIKEDVNNEQLESHYSNVECQLEIDPGRKQVQSPGSLEHSSLPSPEPVNANAETTACLHESKDIDMGNSSPAQRTDSVNADLETENQS